MPPLLLRSVPRANRCANRWWGALAVCTLAVACDDSGSLEVVQGRLEAPASVAFGDVQVGIRMPMTLELANTGSGVLRVLDIRSGPDFTTDAYAFSLDERSFVLPPGEGRRLELGFQPFVVGPAQSSLKIVSDAADDVAPTIVLTGRGVRSGLEVDPEPVDFGPVLVGSSRTLAVRVTNRLSSAVEVATALDAAGVPTITNQTGRGRFELLSPEPDGQGRLAPAPLEPDDAIEVRLRYVPDPSQPEVEDRGRWVIRNCETALCERGVTLMGRGTNAALQCAPAAVDFGLITPGVTLTRTVTCENVANEDVSLLGWELSVDAAPAFAVSPPPEAASVAPGESVDVDVTFSPTVASLGEALEGELRVRGRNPVAGRDLEPVAVRLSGQAGGPDIDVAPTELTFGSVAIGTTKTRGLLVANAGFSPLSVTGVSVEGDGYAIDRDRFVVAPGEGTVVTVRYTPTAEVIDEATIRITSDDGDEAEVVVGARGRGVVLEACDYTVTPTEIRFGIVQVLRSSGQAIRIRNRGTSDCLINGVGVGPGSAPYFGVETSTGAEITLSPGESFTPLATYTPGEAGRHDGVLGFYVSSPDEPNPRIDLTGFGSEAALLVSPNELDFGQVEVDCGTRAKTVSIYNTNAVATSIDRIEIPSEVSGEFSLERLPPGLPGRSIASGQSIEFDVRYRAADLVRDTGVVHVYASGQQEPYVVALLGAGSADPTNEDRFEQLETPEVDILFVIDNSCSMSEEQASLTANFQSFIQFADSQALDYRIGVVSTDASGCPRPGAAERPMGFDQGQCGYFADGNPTERNPDWRLIRPQTQPDPESAFTVVAAQGTSGSGIEHGLEAAYRALSTPLITGWNAGFLRPSAYLALVFVTDEEDQSNNSIDFYVNFLFAIKGFRNSNLVSASAIAGDAGDECGPVSDPGLRYIDVAEQTGGIVERICTPDWARSLQNLGLSVFGYRRRFLLTNQPAAGSVQVIVDGVVRSPTTWSYDPMTNSVRFSPLSIPEPGSEILVTYRAECL